MITRWTVAVILTLSSHALGQSTESEALNRQRDDIRAGRLLAMRALCDAADEARYMEERFGPISAALSAAPKREEKSLHGSWLNCTPNSGPLSSPTVVGAGGKCS